MGATPNPMLAAKQCLDAGRIVEAEALIERALAQEPRDLAARCLAGYAAVLKGDHRAARPHFEIAIDIDPLAFDAHYLHAFTLAELGEHEAACHALSRVLALDPKCSAARVLRARLLLVRG